MVFKDLCRKSLHQVSFSNFSSPRSWRTHCFHKVAKGNVFWSISRAETFPLMTHMCSLKKGFFHHFTCGYLAGESQTQSGNLGLASSKAQALPTRQHCFVPRWYAFPGLCIPPGVTPSQTVGIQAPFKAPLQCCSIHKACMDSLSFCQTSAPSLVLCQDISLLLPSPGHFPSSCLFLWLQVTSTLAS